MLRTRSEICSRQASRCCPSPPAYVLRPLPGERSDLPVSVDPIARGGLRLTRTIGRAVKRCSALAGASPAWGNCRFAPVATGAAGRETDLPKLSGHHHGWVCKPTGRNASEARAGLERDVVSAPAGGRAPPRGRAGPLGPRPLGPHVATPSFATKRTPCRSPRGARRSGSSRPPWGDEDRQRPLPRFPPLVPRRTVPSIILSPA
jgi:hypothetical protein